MNQCEDICNHKDKKALVIRGEDASLQFYVQNEDGSIYPLVGCTGVSGQFAQADGVDWLTIPGYVVSEDAGLAQVDISNPVTPGMFLGTGQNVQLLLTFGSIIRKVQFKDALDVVDDLTNNPPQQTNPWL